MSAFEGKKLVILTGPTAVGKTELSIQAARRLNGSIISADSIQVYRGMDIGSAKIPPSQMQGIDHYLIDVLDPADPFNVTVFQRMAYDAMEKIYAEGRIPIITGGTGFYIQSVLYDIDFTENEENGEIRKRLEQIAGEPDGCDALFRRLAQIDPESAECIDRHNIKRVIRAIEFYELTGRKISAHNEQQRKKESPYEAYYFVLTDERERLYERIEERVDHMMDAGLVQEVSDLLDRGCKRNWVSMQGLGDKEIVAYLMGEMTLEEAVALIKKETRHFAKRQLTWFRREKHVIWLDKSKQSDAEILEQIVRTVL